MPIVPIFLVPIISITYPPNHLSSICFSHIISNIYTCISITYDLSDHLFTYHPSSFTFDIYYICNLYIYNIPVFHLPNHVFIIGLYLSIIYFYLLSIYLSIYPLIICLLRWFLSIHLSFTHPPCIHLLTSSSSIYLSIYLPGISLTQTYIEETVLGQKNHRSSPLVQMCTHAISWL